MAGLEIAQAKIHILYIVGNVPGISYHMLMDKCLSSLYMDFFTFSKAYSDLVSGNLDVRAQIRELLKERKEQEDGQSGTNEPDKP